MDNIFVLWYYVHVLGKYKRNITSAVLRYLPQTKSNQNISKVRKMMNTNTTKKTNKKGFTLVELVVVIAILAILAAIAIPVVANTISSSTRSSALSNQQTLELALKEADAMIQAGDPSVYSTGTGTTVAHVFTEKALDIPATVTVDGKVYTLGWDATNDKCVYVNNNKDLNGNDVTVDTGMIFSTTADDDGKATPANTTVISLFTGSTDTPQPTTAP